MTDKKAEVYLSNRYFLINHFPKFNEEEEKLTHLQNNFLLFNFYQ